MSQAQYTTRGAVAVITLDNPPVNGLGYELRSGLVAGLDRAAADPAVKAVVITGAGKAFSGGADIKEFDSPKALAEPNLHTVIRVVEQSPKPVVAAIHTVCMGGGLELALGCHYRVASPGAQIALPEVKLGMVADSGGLQRLPRRLPRAIATELVLTGRRMSAQEAQRWGLVNQVVPAEGLMQAAQELAAAIVQNAPLALAAVKEVLRETEGLTVAQAYQSMRSGDIKSYSTMLASEDAQEGPRAFGEKRAPLWRGS